MVTVVSDNPSALAVIKGQRNNGVEFMFDKIKNKMAKTTSNEIEIFRENFAGKPFLAAGEGVFWFFCPENFSRKNITLH